MGTMKTTGKPKKKHGKNGGIGCSSLATFNDHLVRFCGLLVSHPHFAGGVGKIRKDYDIPEGSMSELTNGPIALDQRKLNMLNLRIDIDRMNLLWTDIDELLGGFKIPPPFARSVRWFVFRHVTTGATEPKPSVSGDVPTLKPSGDFMKDGYRANAAGEVTWLAINEYTDRRLLEAVRKRIAGERPSRKRFAVPKVSPVMREAWELRRQGMDYKSIVDKFRIEHPECECTHFDIKTMYQKYASALNGIRPLD